MHRLEESAGYISLRCLDLIIPPQMRNLVARGGAEAMVDKLGQGRSTSMKEYRRSFENHTEVIRVVFKISKNGSSMNYSFFA
jgi:hypothetical protein